jgi:hypothetical protein
MVPDKWGSYCSPFLSIEDSFSFPTLNAGELIKRIQEMFNFVGEIFF